MQRGLEFGILPTPIYGSETPYEVQLRENEELVSAAEALGFGYVSYGQHFLGTELRYYQPVPYLTHLAHHAPTMKMLTGIMLLSMANPVDMAEQIATLDVATRGRAIFGAGLGYSDREFHAMGVNPRAKVKRFEQTLEVVKKLWSGEPVTSETPWWSIAEAVPSVRPAQEPRPPIWIAGQSAAAVRRAARMGDAWYAAPFPSHEELAALWRIYKEEREKLGLDLNVDLAVRRELLIADNKSQAARMAAERSELRYRTYRQWGLSGEGTPDGSATEEHVQTHFLLGSSDEIVQQLGELRESLGMTVFFFKAHWPGLPHADAMRQVEKLGTEVIPQLKGA